MVMNAEPDTAYEFGPFRLERDERRLFKNGEPVAVPPKVFDTLVAMVEHRGRLVDKRELMAELWPSTAVEEVNLARNISDLRKILEDGSGGIRYIETVAKKGYRWVAEVRVVVAEEAASPRRRRLWIRVTLAGAVVFLAGVASLERWPSHDKPVKSIAVLPLRPLDSESHEESVEVGLTDSLITRLSGSLDIAVRPTSSILRYLRSPADPLAAGRELKADAVLDSSLLKLNGKMRVTARLLRVRDGRALWAGSFDESRDQLSRIEDAIATQLALKLNRKPETVKEAAVKRGPEYEDYLKGRYFWSQRTRAGVRKAVDYFQQAIAADPSYALAYAGLADAYIFEAGMNAASHEMVPLARQAAERAIQLDPQMAEPHDSLGLIAENHELNWDKADREYRKALELNPRYAVARHWYAEFEGHLGKFEESAKEFEQARELDPLSPAILNDTAKIDLFAKKFDAAVTHSRAAIELDPNFYLAHIFLSYALAKLGRCGEASQEHRQAAQLEDSGYVASTLVWIQWVCGEPKAAEASLAALLERSRREWVSPFNIGVAYASQGDATHALDWFDKAIEDPDSDVLSLKLTPVVDPVRKDPRFQDLLGRLKLQ